MLNLATWKFDILAQFLPYPALTEYTGDLAPRSGSIFDFPRITQWAVPNVKPSQTSIVLLYQSIILDNPMDVGALEYGGREYLESWIRTRWVIFLLSCCSLNKTWQRGASLYSPAYRFSFSIRLWFDLSFGRANARKRPQTPRLTRRCCLPHLAAAQQS